MGCKILASGEVICTDELGGANHKTSTNSVQRFKPESYIYVDSFISPPPPATPLMYREFSPA